MIKFNTDQYKIKGIVMMLLLTVFALQCSAQLNPFQSMYYQNRYLLNPSLAGMDKGLNVAAGYRQQWASFPGAPKTALFTADLHASDKVGLGISVNDEQIGLIHSNRVMASYAYHLPLNGTDEHLNFGISAGINDSRIDYSKINGDASDVVAADYNQYKPYVDGDFGIAYTSNNLLVSALLPNLKSSVFSSSSDAHYDSEMLVFMGAAAYKFNIKNAYSDLTLEPLVAYRIVKGYDDMVDAGINFAMHNYGIYLQSMYHSNKSVTMSFGLGQKTYDLNFAYSITTGQLQTFAQSTFEVGLKVNLFNNSK